MGQRIPHTDSPIETRQAFQQAERRANVILSGAADYILVGQGIGVAPVWQVLSAAIDHGGLGGLAGDDHAQYHTDARAAVLHFLKTEYLASSAGAGDAGKPVKLDAAGHIDATMVNDGDIDHGSISGRDDDDHTLYSLADGTRAFTDVVSGIDPTAATHLATKEYVDQVINFQYRYYFNDVASDIATYFKAETEPTGLPSSSFLTAGLGTGAAQALTEWATDPGEPGAELLEHGIYSMHIHVAVTGTKPTRVFFRLYKRTHPAGAETLIATSEYSDYITTGVGVDVHATLASDAVILPTDRLVWKLLANVEATGSNVDVTLYAEGDSSTHVDLPTSAEVLSTIFLRQDGTKDLTGNMLVDAGITIDGRDISVDGTALDTAVGLQHAEAHDAISHSDIASTGAAIDAAVAHSAHNLTTDISHATITGAHNLTTDIDHDTITNYDANKHIDHTGVSIATAATSGISGGGTIASTRNLALNINGLTGESAIAGGDTLPFYDTTAGASRKITFTELSTALGASDEKVKVDAAATAGYLGVAAGDGVLRTNGTIAWTDGGNFVTLALSHLGIEFLSDAGADKILFWDDGSSATGWLAITGTGKGIVTTNLEINTGFVDRGDDPNLDRVVGDLILDATWRDLDLGAGGLAIVPAGAYAVLLLVQARGTAAGQGLFFRKKGYTGKNTTSWYSQAAGAVTAGFTEIIQLDSNGVIQYNINANYTVMNLFVRGWFI